MAASVFVVVAVMLGVSVGTWVAEDLSPWACCLLFFFFTAASLFQNAVRPADEASGRGDVDLGESAIKSTLAPASNLQLNLHGLLRAGEAEYVHLRDRQAFR